MSGEKRQMEVTQLDEIWDVAKQRWGDPGKRHPKPDSRFETLRGYLNNIESLFKMNDDEDKDELDFVPKRKMKHKSNHDADEIPF